LFNLIFYFFIKHDSKKLNESSLSILNFISLLTFVLSTLLVITFLYIYVIFFNLLNIKQLNNNFIINPNFYFFGLNLHFDFFGIVLLFISYITGFLSLCALDNKMLFKNSRYFSLINIFVLIVFFYILTNNILILFIFYEFLLVPSFLLVFFLSPSRKAIQASLYFVI
jgi:formate hydrogenlyase subunit 3/multisubunit Na+/H+ antiporter MnhD subunit